MLCKDCLGCNKQELNTFKGVNECDNYIKDCGESEIKKILPQQIRINESIRRLGR